MRCSQKSERRRWPIGNQTGTLTIRVGAVRQALTVGAVVRANPRSPNSNPRVLSYALLLADGEVKVSVVLAAAE